MPAKRLPMRKITEVLRLKYEAELSNRSIARAVGTAHSTVGDYLRRAEAAGFTWPLPPEMSGEELEARLFPEPPPAHAARPLPDWQHIGRELRRIKPTGVTDLFIGGRFALVRVDGNSGIHIPVAARQKAGFRLDSVQRGLTPRDYKPLSGIGSGVAEIKISEGGDAYRVVYVA